MSSNEKFEGFKQKLMDENEAYYGVEAREKYGDAAVNASSSKVKGMREEDWIRAEKLSGFVNETLKKACAQGDPSSETAQEVCDLHRRWLCMFWADGAYSKEMHIELARMYCDDERFKKYYEAIAPGATEFLLEALKIYCA